MKLFISILIPLLIGAGAAFFTQAGVHGWYVTANKPSYNPPAWLFAPVWTALYIMMGVALYIIWKSTTDKKLKQTALTLFSIQLLLNFLWSFIFFYAHQTGWAFIDIIFMWLTILATIILFSKISPVAAWLLVPYIFWVSFASLLNFYIWQHN